MTLTAEAKQVVKYWETLVDDRIEWQNTWQEVSDYSVGRGDFVTTRVPGQQRNIRIYDSTSSDANVLLGAAMHSMASNPNTDWFDIRFSEDVLNEDEAGKEWLQAIKPRLRAAFSRPESGFTTQMSELYADLPAFGTACMFIEDDPAIGAKFISVPLREVYIDVDHQGLVTVIFREFQLQAWQAAEMFPQAFEDGLLPKVKKSLDKHPNKKFRFLHHVRRNTNRLPGKIDAANRPWESIYIALDDQTVPKESGFFENPYAVPRWTLDTGEKYGRGPGIKTLPEQKMLNAMWRTYIRGVEKAVDPPLLVEDDGVLPGSSIRVTPSALISVRTDGKLDPVRPLQVGANFPVAKDMVEDRTAKVQKGWHSEIIQAFQDPRMTATQVIELARLSQRILSPVMARLQVDALNPMLVRVFDIESKRSDFPPPPEGMEDSELEIEYVSPIARAQKQSDAQAIMDTFAAVLAVSEVAPEVLDNIDMDVATRAIARGNSVPLGVLRSTSDVEERRAIQQEQEAQQQQMQQLQQGAETVAKLLPGIAANTTANAGAAA